MAGEDIKRSHRGRFTAWLEDHYGPRAFERSPHTGRRRIRRSVAKRVLRRAKRDGNVEVERMAIYYLNATRRYYR